MALGLSRDDWQEAIYISLCPATWEQRFTRPSENYLLQAADLNASMAQLGDRILEDVECVSGPSPSHVSHALVNEGEQVKLGFRRQDSEDYFTAEVDLLDFKCALIEMSKLSGMNPLQLTKSMRVAGESGKLINRETLSRHFLLLAAFGSDIREA